MCILDVILSARDDTDAQLNILVIEHHLKSHEAKTESEETINDLCKDLESVIRRLGIPLSAEPDGKVDHVCDLITFSWNIHKLLTPPADTTVSTRHRSHGLRA